MAQAQAARIGGDLFQRMSTEAGRTDPYPLYAEARERGLSRSIGGWLVARHATARAAIGASGLGADQRDLKGYRAPALSADDPRAAFHSDEVHLMLFADPPVHTRQRTFMARAFGAVDFADLEQRVAARIAELFDAVADETVFDVMERFAFAVPAVVFGELLRIPREHDAELRRWGTVLGADLDPLNRGTADSPWAKAGAEMAGFLLRLIARKRANPQDDMLSFLINDRVDGESLSTGELLAAANLLFGASFGPTSNLIGNGTLALARHPEQYETLRDNPKLHRDAIEEVVRFDSPIQLTSRIVREPVTLEGLDFTPGDKLLIMLGAANHDPAVFEAPERFDVTRTDAAHNLSFSGGIHACLGAPIARSAFALYVAELTRRRPALALASEPVRRRLLVLRGLTTLPVKTG